MSIIFAPLIPIQSWDINAFLLKSKKSYASFSWFDEFWLIKMITKHYPAKELIDALMLFLKWVNWLEIIQKLGAYQNHFWVRFADFFLLLRSTEIWWNQLRFAGICLFYSVAHTNLDSSKNMLLLKNPQFLRNHCETLSQ